jgi:hypothetical protein
MSHPTPLRWRSVSWLKERNKKGRSAMQAAFQIFVAKRGSITWADGTGQAAVVGAVVGVPQRMPIADPLGQHFELLA